MYDCQWGTDVVRVIAAANLPREAHNAPLHLFSASPGLVSFGRDAYRQHSEQANSLLGTLIEKFQREGFAMYTMEDFQREYAKKNFSRLTPEERREAIQSLPPQEQQEILERAGARADSGVPGQASRRTLRQAA